MNRILPIGVIIVSFLLLMAGRAYGAPDSMEVEQAEPQTVGQAAARYGALIGFPTVVLAYGMETWDWGSRGSWRWGDEGWFGRDTDLGGADKFGHMWACYAITRISWSTFSYSEGDSWTKWLFTPLVAFTIGLGIEVGDAYTGKYGFSYQDLVMDSLGIALGMAFEAFPKVGAFVGFSLSYWPTNRFLDYEDRTLMDIESDISGYRYLLSFKLNGFHEIGFDVPDALRYLMLDLGYYTHGFSKYDEAVGDNSRRRNFFIGLSLNTAEVIRSAFRNSGSNLQAVTATPFEYFHVPVGLTKSFALD